MAHDELNETLERLQDLPLISCSNPVEPSWAKQHGAALSAALVALSEALPAPRDLPDLQLAALVKLSSDTGLVLRTSQAALNARAPVPLLRANPRDPLVRRLSIEAIEQLLLLKPEQPTSLAEAGFGLLELQHAYLLSLDRPEPEGSTPEAA